MKKFNIGLFVLVGLMLVLAACGDDSAKEYEAEAVKDTDVCEICGMDIEDNQHATQIVLENEKSVMFDDLGDLYVWKSENNDAIGAEFVRDFHTKKWLETEDATFVYDETIETPMAYGVISFADAAEAEEYVANESIGVVLTKAELDEHVWESTMDDHDEHDDHEAE